MDFGDFELRDISRTNCAEINIEIDMDKLHMEFSALNMDFDGPSLDFLSSSKSAHDSIKERYPRKVVILPLNCWSVFRQNVADRYGYACYLSQQALVTSFLVVSTSMTLKDPKFSK